jgi:hypothetical protein
VSTPTIALTAAEGAAIERARNALGWIHADTFPWPAPDRAAEIKHHADELRGTLDDYAGLTAGSIHPATLFPDLGRGQDNALETALDRVTADIRDWTRELEALARAAEKAARALEQGRAA